jgi:HrpA-like RNA helicase
MKTNNYYVQYKHQNGEHTNNIFGNYLKIVTDGTLYESIKTNPVMRKKINNQYIDENINDIIIIDEAHEHNTNMDLIITLARQTCFFNNMIRLIIISATMDDDEPIYRRYFKDIYDEKLYPIKQNFIHPILDIDFDPNPLYMDRRYHISPPGETTQYIIEEYYENNEPNTGDESINANIIQENAYKKVIEICNSNKPGEILFFALGKNEIAKTVEYLNKIMPKGNVALPYYGEGLHQNYKDIISKIDEKYQKLKIKEIIYILNGEKILYKI